MIRQNFSEPLIQLVAAFFQSLGVLEDRFVYFLGGGAEVALKSIPHLYHAQDSVSPSKTCFRVRADA
jgi:hypothetical protein